MRKNIIQIPTLKNMNIKLLFLLFFGKLLLSSDRLFAQVIPNTQTQPGAGIRTINPTPSAYSTNALINYERTWEAEKPFSSVLSLDSTQRTVYEVKQTTQYVDGLGRPIQTV